MRGEVLFLFLFFLFSDRDGDRNERFRHISKGYIGILRIVLMVIWRRIWEGGIWKIELVEKKERERRLTKRCNHHDIGPRQILAAEKVTLVGGSRELGFEEVEMKFQIGENITGFDGGNNKEDEGSEEERGAGFERC